jgi:hypothetical protein
MFHARRRRRLFIVLSIVLIGCHSTGPTTVPRDRSDYCAAISESWKRQTLLDIVKLRYLDPPIFVDVGQIVAGYSLETSVGAAGSFPEVNNFGGNTATVTGSARFTDRPTITYTPLTGNRFIRGLMTPLSPESVFFTIQSGWPADGVLMATAASINGLKNQEISPEGVKPPDADFLRALALMRKLQRSGAVGMRIQVDAKQQRETALLAFRTHEDNTEAQADSRELRRLLNLSSDATQFTLVFGPTASSDKEIALQTRSIIQLMQTMASQIDVPAQDLADGRVTRGWESVSGDRDAVRLVQIKSSSGKPSDAFVSINFRNHWFWIDDRDLRTKRAFAFTMLLFTLADTGEKQPLPLVTIPAQ